MRTATLVSAFVGLRTVGPWNLVEEIGRGGHGAVWTARHATTGQEAAVKLLRREGSVAPAAIRREIRALVRMSSGRSHPSLVRFLDHGLEEGVPWYAMELVQGEGLDRLDVTELGRGRILAIVRRLASALAFLHGEGMIHGDLKPANVIVRERRWPVLVDFGLVTTFGGARYRETVDAGAVPGGTPAYMAPEQCRGEPSDGRVDLYALGCILYELVTGEPPFTGSRGEVLLKHLEEAPAPPSRHAEVPAELEELILALLAKRPAERLGHADDVAARLEQLGGAKEEGEQEAPPPRAYVYRPRLVGRDAVMDEIEGWLQEGSASRRKPELSVHASGALLVEAPALMLLAGESGAGKTRILMEAATRGQQSGMMVLSGAGDHGSDVPLEVMRGPLEAIADRCLERGPREVSRILGEHAKVLAPYEPALLALPSVAALPEPRELPPRLATRRLFGALLETLDQLARRGRGLLLVVDDLQWADRLSLDFLEHAAAHRSGEPRQLWVIGAHRREEAPDLMERLCKRRLARRLTVGRLDEASVGAMAADMLGMSTAPPALARFLESRTEGTPLFVAEYLRLAVDRGLLRRDRRGRWNAGGELLSSSDEIALPLPTAVREVVSERLAALSPAARGAVAVAAVLGRETTETLWSRAAELAESRADEVFAELLARHVLDTDGLGNIRFSHDRVREEIMGGLDAARAGALHRAAAVAIEEIHGAALDAHRGALGRHWEAAGDPERAAAHYLAGARAATTRFAYAEGERLYRAYLSVVDSRSAAAAEARWRLAFECLYEAGRIQEALAELELAAPFATATTFEAAVLVSLGLLRRAASRHAESLASYEAALDVSRRTGDRAREVHALAGLASHKVDEGRFLDALGGYEEALEIARSLGDPRQESRLMANVALMHEALGHHDVAEAAFLRVLDLARATGDRVQEGTILSNLGNLVCNVDRNADAVAFYEQALAIHREVGHVRFEALVLAQLAEVVRRRDAGEGVALFDRAVAIARKHGDRRIEGKVLGSAAEVLRGTARATEVAPLLRRAVELLDEGRDDQLGWFARARLAEELSREPGGIEEARRLVAEARPTVRAMQNAQIEGLLCAMEANVELQGGDPEAAVAAAEQAVARLEVRGYERLALALALLGLARAATGRDCRDDLARAEEATRVLDPLFIPGELLGRMERLRAAAAR